MSDAKYFQRGKIQELRAELNSDKKDPKHTTKRVVMKKIVANMTMGNDMSPLFPDVLSCMQVPVLEVKKMVYLYLVNYAKTKPDMAIMAVNSFVKDVSDSNPLLRALSIRTMSYISVDKITDCLCEPLRLCMKDQDPYVRKTAATTVAKLWWFDSELCEREGFMDLLKDLLNDSNPTVVSNAVAALCEIHDRSTKFDFKLDVSLANKLLTAMNECSEWGQTYILEALMLVATPLDSADAELLAERIVPRLQHANSAVVLTAIKVILYFINFVTKPDVVATLYKKLGPPLVTLLHNGPEVQFVALRNILLILQKRPDFLKGEMKVFFCKYNDPIYVKLAKLEIIFKLANDQNIEMVLNELKEYSSEVDIDFVRKSVRTIGRCAIKIESAADRCVDVLVELVQTKVNYVVQEGVVVIEDIFRKYPNRYESILGMLCENLDSLDEPEAKASMIWIIGQYADRIQNADELLEGFLESFKEEPAEVQLSLLTAVVKLFIKRPSAGQDLVPKVLKWSTEEVDNPDLRDRGFIYWRLLSTDPVAAKAIVLGERPPISTESDNMDPALLDCLLIHINTIASIYHRPPETFIGGLKNRIPPAIAGTAKAVDNQGKTELKSVYGNEYMSNPYAANIAINSASGKQVSNLLDLEDEAPQNNLGDLGLDYDLGANRSPMSPPFQQKPSPAAPGAVALPGLTSVAPFNAPAPGLPMSNISPVNNMKGMPSMPIQPIASSVVNDLASLNLGTTTAMASQVGLDSALLSMSSQTSYIPPKTMFLSAQNGKGLEIMGTFARRQGQMMMEMTFTNRALQPLSDFAIQFNKNTFCICPGGALEVRPSLIPNQSTDAVLRLRIEGLPQLMNPVNNLQVAVKTNAGIVYFQTQVPLHILFTEQGQLDQGTWLKMWKEDISAQNELRFKIQGLMGMSNIQMVRSKLQSNNVFAVAERVVDGMMVLYASSKLTDGTIFLVELKFDGGLMNADLAIKTYATHLGQVAFQAIDGILKA